MRRRPWWFAFAGPLLGALVVAGSESATEPTPVERARALEAITRANIGLAYLEQGSAGKALAEFKRVIELFPDEPLGYANLGVAQFRLNRHQEAERSVNHALSLDPSDFDLHVLLGEILQAQGREADALRSYEKALALAPTHVRASYKLAKLAEKQKAWPAAVEHLKAITHERPDNLPVLLDLARLLAQHGSVKEALDPLRQVAALFEEVEGDFLKFLNEALGLAEASRGAEAATRTQIFTNLVRPRALYRQGIAQLAPQVFGLPLERFTPRVLALVPEAVPRPVPVRFREVTAEVGMPVAPLGATAAVFFDADSDGRLDLFVCSSVRVRLFRSGPGGFSDITDRAGFPRDAQCTTALVGDYDNDGRLDLYLVRDGVHAFYRNDGGRFIDVTAQAGVGHPGKGRGAVFADLDHDGDLDLFVANEAAGTGSAPSRLYRNRGDGRFEEITRSAGLELGGLPLRAAVAGDLDDDGDLDLLVVGDGTVRLYSNLRQGRFKDIAKESGLLAPGRHEAVALGDYNNDGWLDVFLAGAGEHSNRLFRNLGAGRFAEVPGAVPLRVTGRTAFSDVRFADFDNDGYLDVLLTGGNGAPGLRLFRNTGRGGFTEVSEWLPPTAGSPRQAVVADYDEDGDLDVLLVLPDGRVSLLRNEGGNANRWLKVRLKGLNVGNSKNNLDGLGAKVEIKAGPLYAMRLVESPVTHFGLGTLAKADLLRVTWPNGETDSLFEPSTDQVVKAEQRLKGSCPFLYTWDGERYTFVTDIHWRNLLGMVLPDGSWAPPDPAKDYFKIPGAKLRPRNGVYSVQITEELWETTFLDQVRLLVVDHPEGTEVVVNEAFVPPPFPPLQLSIIRTRRSPVAAVNDQGQDILPLIRWRDGKHVASFTRTAYQGYTKEHAITLDLGDLSRAPRILLVLHGWLTPFDSSLNLAVSQRGDVPFRFPALQVVGTDGRWQTAIENIGAPAGKDKTVVVDLTGKFPTTDFRVRIVTTMEIAWDEIFVSTDGDLPPRIASLALLGADLHYRGFSHPYRASEGGPTLFDYARVTTAPRWRPMAGFYTRYGDVRPLLLAPDDMYVVMGPGDELTVEFDAHRARALKPGWVRDFVIYTEGWIKEGETNGAFAQTVEPLVFHGMSRYPYGPNERYPADETHQEFLRRYMTRLVTADAYREQVMRYVPGLDEE